MTPIKSAIEFVRQSVQEPALAHPTLPTAIREKVKNANRWLPQFRRVGDLPAALP